jgi:hypothetical protein
LSPDPTLCGSRIFFISDSNKNLLLILVFNQPRIVEQNSCRKNSKAQCIRKNLLSGFLIVNHFCLQAVCLLDFLAKKIINNLNLGCLNSDTLSINKNMKALFIVIIAIHGLIHLMGFVKAFNLAEISQLKQPISNVAGIFWLITALLFLTALLLFLVKSDSWWILAAAAIVVSQVLVIQDWNDAKFGTIANVLLFLPVFMAFMNAQPSSYQNRFKTEVQNRLMTSSETDLVSEKDIENLPPAVQKYLEYAGAIGKPKVHNFRMIAKGSMRRSLKSKWININARQYNFYDEPSRFFYIKSKMYGIPFDGLHAYSGNSATMLIKVASLFQVVDAKGEKMNQSENVTMFNDMCLLAPATLIDKNIKWESTGPLTAKAMFTNNNITISAMLYFNEKGELINFVSDDRYLSADGKSYKNYRWSTPCKDYKNFDGRKVASFGEAIWHMPEGEYSYGKFNICEVDYNCSEYK